jgi:8-oxo-dGTP diphosphatase
VSEPGGPRKDTPRRVADVAWDRWRPVERATLLFAIIGGRLLLIRKKTGLGAGKVNGPGGRIGAGEGEREAAIREVEEELRATPTGVAKRGELFFQFLDGYSLGAAVFSASGLLGTPTETREATPVWVARDRIPYDEMWADDRLWMPHLLAGRLFRGWFIFDGDLMLDARVEVLEPGFRALEAGADGPGAAGANVDARDAFAANTRPRVY